MSEFTIHTSESAPVASRILLEQARSKFGFVPNLIGLMAEAPATVKAYLALGEALSETSFTPVEQQVITLAVSSENECTYCMAAHSAVARMAGMFEPDLEALREGRPMPDARLEVLRSYVSAVIRTRGWPSAEQQAAFKSAGYTSSQMLEVLVGVAMKTLSNYVNHLADTPLDKQFAGFAWKPASAAVAERR